MPLRAWPSAGAARREWAGFMESGTELAGRYRLESPLGHGETDEAWRGRDLVLDREVAVKVLPAGVPGPGEERQFRRLITDIACTSLAAKRIEAFVLCDDGSMLHSSLRLAQEGTIDWSTWVRLPLPPGHVTAIAACQFDQRDGAVIVATSDGGIHFAKHEIEVIKTGLSRWSQWSRVPGA
jgi:hypothetical protein